MNIEQRKNPKHWKPERGWEAMERERERVKEAQGSTLTAQSQRPARIVWSCGQGWWGYTEAYPLYTLLGTGGVHFYLLEYISLLLIKPWKVHLYNTSDKQPCVSLCLFSFINHLEVALAPSISSGYKLPLFALGFVYLRRQCRPIRSNKCCNKDTSLYQLLTNSHSRMWFFSGVTPMLL